MNYEEKYKEALENLRKIKESNKDNNELVEFIECKFPELKESKAEWVEKIRKELKDYLGKRPLKKLSESDAVNQWIYWIEKQCEKKPALSEDDEKIRKDVISFVKQAINAGYGIINKEREEKWIAWLENQGEPQDKGEISDGYHTFNELYYYRMLYNVAFFNMLPKEWVHKSKRHNDGEECFGGGWFIVMANLPTGQISNHYELKDWDLFQIPEKEIADKWDGHTPQEAADRLHKYLLKKHDEQKESLCDKCKIEQPSHFGHDIISLGRWALKHQSKQESNRVEPKFKVGDWVANNCAIWYIDDIRDGLYNLKGPNCGNIINSNQKIIDEKFHLWTIEDAKDGDVLYSPYHKLLWIYKDGNSCYVGNNLNYNENSVFVNSSIFIPAHVIPATKEQRDLLFQKIKESGYEWDAEKKELKKI